jgi:hypothetical protein
MTDADRKDFGIAMAALGFALGKTVEREELDAYWQFLRDLDLEALKRAVGMAGRTLRFFPKPSELRELAGRSRSADIATAWEAVRAAMDRYDYTHSVDFGPLVNAVVRNLGGWVEICGKSILQLVWVRKDFERVYEAFASTDHASLRGEPLRGAFGGEPVRIAIAGVTPPLQLPPAPNGASTLVRQLADSKTAP